MSDIFENFGWHSAIGIDSTIENNKQFYTKLPNKKEARGMFVASGDFLIHKATKCLWKISDDEESIVPVFSSDVLSEEDLMENT